MLKKPTIVLALALLSGLLVLSSLEAEPDTSAQGVIESEVPAQFGIVVLEDLEPAGLLGQTPCTQACCDAFEACTEPCPDPFTSCWLSCFRTYRACSLSCGF